MKGVSFYRTWGCGDQSSSRRARKGQFDGLHSMGDSNPVLERWVRLERNPPFWKILTNMLIETRAWYTGTWIHGKFQNTEL